MKIILDLEHGSPEWLKWRRGGLGSSDIAAICGVCPYKTAFDIYNDKLGMSVNRRNGAMQRGIDFEDEARNVFAINKSGLWKPINIEKDGEPVFKASLDGYSPYSNCILEIKVPSRKVMDMARYGQIPAHYLYQIQWQLFVSDCPKAYYFTYSPDSLESHTVEVYPDADLIEKILVKVTEFWQNLQNGIPPSPPRSKKEACAETSAILKQMLECKEAEKEATERYKMLLADLMQIEGVEDGLESDSATLSISERSSVDYKKACEDAGINLDAYKKPLTKVWVIRAKAAL
jgi:putative phage-type endonuclease